MQTFGFLSVCSAAVMAAALGSPVSADASRDVVLLTNQFRAAHNLPALKQSHLLESVAQTHGEDMRFHGFFAHRGSDGSSIAERAERQGYSYCMIAENIALGHRNAKSVTRDWIQSPGHRRNMLSRNVREIGVVREGRYWVMVLGRQC